MAPQEFKAWFDGFTEALGGPPNKEQWNRIKERVAEIDSHWYLSSQQLGAGIGTCAQFSASNQLSTVGLQSNNAVLNSGFNSILAMNNIGRAEAEEIN